MVEYYRLTLEDRPRQAELDKAASWIVAYNLAQVGNHWTGRLTLFARDGAGGVAGALWGFTDRGWLRIEVLIVREEERGQGLGSRLLHAAENEARQRGCHGAWLDTFSWQAKPFYERHGYVVFGALEDYPTGHARLFLRKSLIRNSTAT